jgi:hypothetical protein
MKVSGFSITVLFLLFFILATGQRGNIWYFGINAGLDFKTNPPSILTNGKISNQDYSSAISDSSGNLLFYTDGINVWTKIHVVMPNGSGLIGNSSAGQCALIVPIPASNQYVIFHTTEFASPGYLHYTVVDMTLNGGLGDVVISKKNVSLGTGWTEKLCAYYNDLNNSYWILTHRWQSNEFISFRVDMFGVSTQSVISAIGSNHNCGTYGAPHDAMGELTVSPDGNKVINAITCLDKFELFDFNVSTGVLTNSISIQGDGTKAWGTAFSPDSKKLYLNGTFGSSIYQFDITSNNETLINASKFAIVTASASGYNFGYMELASNNKIYVAKPNMQSLAVIFSPNVAGSGCQFNMTGQALSGECKWGLSRIAYNIPTNSPAVGLGPEESKRILRIYPNPFHEKLIIDSPQYSLMKCILFNSYGDVIFEINLERNLLQSESVVQMDLSYLEKGIYYLKCADNVEVTVQKLIKE